MALFDRLQRLWRTRAKHATSLLKGATTPPTASASHKLQVANATAKPPPSASTPSLVSAAIPSASTPSLVSAAIANEHVSPPPPSPPPPRKDDTRLPDVMWKPEQEFPGKLTIQRDRMSFSRESQILLRIATVACISIFKPMRIVILGGFSAGVVCITSYEASVLLDPACSLADALAFTFKYSLENFNASVIWETRDATLVAQSLGLNSEEILRTLDPANHPADAQRLLHLHSLYTMRSIVAGSMVIAQLLSIIRESMRATTRYIENVYTGHEPPLKGVTERIIRLAGDGSDVTEVSMARYGAHILPVYENPAKWRHLIGLWSFQGWIPCVWQVASGQYGYRHSWEQLEVDESFMLRTTTGKYILCIEADATNLDRAHDLQKPNNDVTLEEASQAYRMIERAASRKINRPFRSLAVFLGDSQQLCDTGGTEFVTLRERIRLKKEVDVLIDAKAPLLLAILKWCTRFAEKYKTIVLDATPLNYGPLKLLLEKNGYTVLTPSEADAWMPPPPKPGTTEASDQSAQLPKGGSYSNDTSCGSSKSSTASSPSPADKAPASGSSKPTAKSSSSSVVSGAKATPTEKAPPGAKPPTATISDKKEKLPRLIYYPTTAATINAVHTLLSAGLAEPRHCCVLINSPFGLSHLKEIAEYEEQDFHPICAAEIYDDYFRQVRIWTRMGHAPSAIQKELDTRFATVLDVQKEIAQLQRMTTTMNKL
jgi:hypothetical protein